MNNHFLSFLSSPAQVDDLHTVVGFRVPGGRSLGKDHEITVHTVVTNPITGKNFPVLRVFSGMDGLNAIGELEILAGRLQGTHSRDPHRKPEPGNTPRGSAASGGDDHNRR
jgi:hypothetical protein